MQHGCEFVSCFISESVENCGENIESDVNYFIE